MRDDGTQSGEQVTRHWWNEDEDAILRSMYSNHSMTEIAVALACSVNSVRGRLNTLHENKGGVKRTPAGHLNAKTTHRPVDGCWKWEGQRTTRGYGAIQLISGRWLAHRLALYVQNGRLPRHLDVLHTCDNRLCARPDHLYLGTDVENQRDRRVRRPQRLSVEDVRRLRNRFYVDGAPMRVLAREYPDVPQGTIRSAISGENFSWVPMPNDARYQQYLATREKP